MARPCGQSFDRRIPTVPNNVDEASLTRIRVLYHAGVQQRGMDEGQRGENKGMKKQVSK